VHKIILTVVILLVLLFLSVVIAFDIIPPIFWSAKEFSNPSYHRILEKEWLSKPNNFLLLKLHSIDPMRFGLAAYILGQRKEQKAVNILVKKVQSSYIDNQIHFSACSALAQISPSIAKNVLFEIVRKYKNSKGSELPEGSRYRVLCEFLHQWKTSVFTIYVYKWQGLVADWKNNLH